MVLKGLPEEYRSFVVITIQSEKQQTFREFKVALQSFEDTERANIATRNHSVMKRELKQDPSCMSSVFNVANQGISLVSVIVKTRERTVKLVQQVS